MGEERCAHGLVVGQCGECKPPSRGLPGQVYVTVGGAGLPPVPRLP